MLLQKINQKRAFQLVAEQLEEAILSGSYKPGDKLPPEREMKTTLGTSRRSLREAMRVLEQKGLIETRVGVKGGSFVKSPSSDTLLNDLAVLIRFKKVPVTELAELHAQVAQLRRQLLRLVDRRMTPLEAQVVRAKLSDEEAKTQTRKKLRKYVPAAPTAPNIELYNKYPARK